MPNIVPPSGPLSAKIAVIGEAPGENEDLQGEPFVGLSGSLLAQWWDAAGIDRWGVYKDNVVPYRPRDNNIWSVPKKEVAGIWVPALFERLSKLTDARVIVPTGNLACSALLGSVLGKVPGILSIRGSIYDISAVGIRSGAGRTWCIPTIHPAWFLRGQLKKQERAVYDWRRICRVAREGHRGSVREILSEPSSAEVAYFRANVGSSEKAHGGVLAIDIETAGRDITCVGFAASARLSIVFPTLTIAQRKRYWPIVKSLCESEHEKVLQNGHYDLYWLSRAGVRVKNWLWDTMWMHHALNPSDNHGLQHLASLYAYDYQAWKEEREGGEEKEFGSRVKDPRLLWSYNGKDCLYTREVFDYLQDELRATGMLDFYHAHYSRLFYPLLDTMLHGVRVDTAAQRRVREGLLSENTGIRKELKALAGYELYAVEEKLEWREPSEDERGRLWRAGKGKKLVYDRELAKELGYAGSSKKGLIGVKVESLKKDFSGVKLRRYFYEDLGLPKQMKLAAGKGGKKRVVSVDETSLKKLALKHTTKAGEAVRLILQHRENKGEIDDFNGKWDRDGRIRCQYSFNTEAGRFASKANPMRTGRNLQNVKRGAQRRTYLPDEGCVFLAIDGSQVEDRVVKMLTGSPRLVELANTKPLEFDAHRYNASRIFNIPEREVTKAQRELGKMAVHAAQRGMRGYRLADRLLTQSGLVKTPEYCQKLIDNYLNDHWEIRDWYFPAVRKSVLEYKDLWNTWGRRWRCEYDKMDDDLYRRAYSFGPQSECNDLMVQWGYVPVMEKIAREGLASRVCLLVHDELILSCPPGEVYELARFLIAKLEQPREYPAGTLVVPMDVSVGSTWGDKVELGVLPGREEFNEKVRGVMR